MEWWSKDGRVIHRGRKKQILEIEKIKQWDSGVYICHGTVLNASKAMSVQVFFEVLVAGKVMR